MTAQCQGSSWERRAGWPSRGQHCWLILHSHPSPISSARTRQSLEAFAENKWQNRKLIFHNDSTLLSDLPYPEWVTEATHGVSLCTQRWQQCYYKWKDPSPLPSGHEAFGRDWGKEEYRRSLRAPYLWFMISTLPYCSIQSLPTMMLCTQQVGFVHVYASLCLKNNPKPREVAEKNQLV